MSRSEDTVWCDGCGTEIRWVPYLVGRQDYCCQDCSRGFSCACKQTMEPEDEYWEASASISSSNLGY